MSHILQYNANNNSIRLHYGVSKFVTLKALITENTVQFFSLDPVDSDIHEDDMDGDYSVAWCALFDIMQNLIASYQGKDASLYINYIEANATVITHKTRK